MGRLGLQNAFSAGSDGFYNVAAAIVANMSQAVIILAPDSTVYMRNRAAARGCGMTEEQVSQAFEPFFTTKAPGKGTGLGLAVSYRLVKHQGGHIKIDSSAGAGTVVTVSFRAVDPADETAASQRGFGQAGP